MAALPAALDASALHCRIHLLGLSPSQRRYSGASRSPPWGVYCRDGVPALPWLREKIGSRRRPAPCASSDETADISSPSNSEGGLQDDLAAKLAAAQAEAEALRKELGARRGAGGAAEGGPSSPFRRSASRIDGTGFRETLFSDPGRRTGRADQQMGKWGLSEADLFLAKGGGPTEGMRGIQGPAEEEGAEAVVRRRVLIGLGLTGVTVALALFKLPTSLTRPTKPLFFYLVPVVALQEGLQYIAAEGDNQDVVQLREDLRRVVGSPADLKDNLISAANLLEGAKSDRAASLAFQILEYLDQADYSRYFENRGRPSPKQQEEFLKFSLDSIGATLKELQDFLSLVPAEDKDAARMQLTNSFLEL